MEIGMLWYDDDSKRKLDDKIARAAEFYRTKYGAPPTVCFLNPSMVPEGTPDVSGGVRLRPARLVLANHFWIGVDDAASLAAPVKNGNGSGKASRRKRS